MTCSTPPQRIHHITPRQCRPWTLAHRLDRRLVAGPCLDSHPAQASFSVVDTIEELEALLPAELYAIALRAVEEEPVVEDLDM